MADVTVLSIVQKLEAAVARFRTTGDKSSLKGTFSWAKGVARKIDMGYRELIEEEPFESVLPEEVVVEDEEQLPFFSEEDDED